MIGQTISHYKILEKLGEGGMGVVYKAEDTKLKRTVALKFLPLELTKDEEAKERFFVEAQAAASLSHSNIVTVHEINEHEDQTYIAMEYVDGENLKDIIIQNSKFKIDGRHEVTSPSQMMKKEGKETWTLHMDRILNITIQICEGLREAHAKEIVHRDIKCANIVVTEKGVAKILDFGLAKLRGQSKLTKLGTTLGTAAYMSPEQYMGKEVDHRTDIWSLGVVLYEMISGQLPFKGDYEQAIIYSILNDKPESLTSLRSGIPPELETIVNKALGKKPSDRYQYIEELLVDLKKSIKDFGPKLKVSQKKGDKKKSDRSRKPKQTVFIPLAIILLVGGFFIFKSIIKWGTSSIPEGFASENKKSIAVLPFADMSPNKDQEYFCDGIAEELINNLTKVSGFLVTARTSAFSFKGKNFDIPTIGKKLNVELVLEGSVRKEGDDLRITAQLIKVSDGYHLWSDAYNRKLKDVFAIQEDISRSIVDRLKINLMTEEEANLEKRQTTNIDAYNLYLKGRYFWGKRTEEGLKKSLEYFQLAIDKDPQYALAYVGKADAYTILAYWGFLSPKVAFPKAKVLAKKALQIDNSLAEAYTTLAWIYFDYEWDWAAAEHNYKKAIKLKPGYATTYHWYGAYFESLGRFEESLKMRKQALKLDPFSLLINAELSNSLIRLGRFDEAKEQLLKTLEMGPNFSPAHLNLGHLYSEKGEFEIAIRAYSRALSIPWAAGFLGYAYAKAGKIEKAREILAELKESSEESYIRPSAISLVYYGLGDLEKAFDWLEKAIQERDPVIPWIRQIVPKEDQILSDPRYKAILRKIGLDR
jgi:serine/threonine-protein kinase